MVLVPQRTSACYVPLALGKAKKAFGMFICYATAVARTSDITDYYLLPYGILITALAIYKGFV